MASFLACHWGAFSPVASTKGGGKLAGALDKIARAIGKAETLRVGFLEGAKYPDGTSVAAVAAVQDFGAPRAGIPPRPFFRSMIAAKKSEWPDAIAKLLVANDYDADKTLRQAGAAIVGQLQQSIRDTNAPPLKPGTIKAKGFSKPLIDTSHMIKSADYEVK